MPTSSFWPPLCFLHLRNITKLRTVVSQGELEKLDAFVSSQLACCNALSPCLSKASINRRQAVQKAAAKLLTRKFSHITPLLKSLHWLPVNFRYQFKILTRTVLALRGEAPTYIVKLLHANSPNWILRYTDSGLLGILHLSENHRGLCLPNLSAKAMDLSLFLSLI